MSPLLKQSLRVVSLQFGAEKLQNRFVFVYPHAECWVNVYRVHVHRERYAAGKLVATATRFDALGPNTPLMLNALRQELAKGTDENCNPFKCQIKRVQFNLYESPGRRLYLDILK